MQARKNIIIKTTLIKGIRSDQIGTWKSLNLNSYETKKFEDLLQIIQEQEKENNIQVENLTNKLKELKIEAAVETQKLELQLLEHRKTIDKLKVSKHNYKQQFNDVKLQKQELDNQKNKIQEELDKKKEELLQQIENQTQQYNQMQQKIEQLELTIESQKMKIERLQEQLNERDDKIKRKNEKIQMNYSLIQQGTQFIQGYELSRNYQQFQFQQENYSLRNNLQNIQQNEIQQLKNENQQFKNENQQLKHEKQLIENQKEQIVKENNELKTKIKLVKQELQYKTNELNEYYKKYQSNLFHKIIQNQVDVSISIDYNNFKIEKKFDKTTTLAQMIEVIVDENPYNLNQNLIKSIQILNSNEYKISINKFAQIKLSDLEKEIGLNEIIQLKIITREGN